MPIFKVSPDLIFSFYVFFFVFVFCKMHISSEDSLTGISQTKHHIIPNCLYYLASFLLPRCGTPIWAINNLGERGEPDNGQAWLRREGVIWTIMRGEYNKWMSSHNNWAYIVTQEIGLASKNTALKSEKALRRAVKGLKLVLRGKGWELL